MVAITLGLYGLLVFILAVLALGVVLRRYPTKETAERTSRICHALFFICLGLPFVISVFSPGLAHVDEAVGLAPLPYQPIPRIIGILLAIPGLYYMGVSNISLRKSGSGANAFRLTRNVVEKDVYKTTRNPMSLGYYLLALGIGLISGSTLLTLYSLLGIIPAHLFYLKYFEELELEIRFGEAYKQYRQGVPFLIPKSSRV